MNGMSVGVDYTEARHIMRSDIVAGGDGEFYVVIRPLCLQSYTIVKVICLTGEARGLSASLKFYPDEQVRTLLL